MRLWVTHFNIKMFKYFDSQVIKKITESSYYKFSFLKGDLAQFEAF